MTHPFGTPSPPYNVAFGFSTWGRAMDQQTANALAAKIRSAVANDPETIKFLEELGITNVVTIANSDDLGQSPTVTNEYLRDFKKTASGPDLGL